MQGFVIMSGASDPRVLLDAMSSMLGENGDMKGPQEVLTIISLMKDAEKMLSRFTFLNILRATFETGSEKRTASETIHKFVKDGGCAILNKWLQEAMTAQNIPLIMDILELLEAMPITIEALKQGNIGKLVKQLSKREEENIKELASSILSKWMVLVKGRPKKNKKSSDQNEEQSNQAASKRSRENFTNKDMVGKSSYPPEKKIKTLNEAKNSVTSLAKPPPKAKVIPALPKLVMESSGFMNALIQQQTALPVKKKKKVATPPSPKQATTGPLEEILFNQTQTHKQGEEKVKDEKSNENDKKQNETEKSESSSNNLNTAQDENDESKPSPEACTLVSQEVTEDVVANVDSTNKAPLEQELKSVDSEAPTPDAVPVESAEKEMKDEVKTSETTRKGKKKKNIKWEIDERLVRYHYYEPDDEERVAVQHIINFHDAQQQEAMRERQRVEQAKRLSDDKMLEQLQWYRPRALDVNELMERGKESQEKSSQKERESNILAHIFFSKSSLPISPSEPDPEPKTASSASSQPLVIPHDEKGTVYPLSKGLMEPEPDADNVIPTTESGAAANVTLPPALAALLATASKGTAGSNNAEGAAALSNVDVQTLLKKLVASQEPGNQNLGEVTGQRFPSPLINQTLRVPGRLGMLGQDFSRHGLPDFRSRGLLPTPNQSFDPTRFLGMRGRFPLAGGHRLRHPLPGQRITVPMGRGAAPGRFPMPNKNQDSVDEHFTSEGDIPKGQFRSRGTRLRGPRVRPPCRHFRTPRGCLRGNSCPFLHVRGTENGPPS
ncbi:serine/threonine-protein phosphatase 1 regulatory subunit 10-like isoform X2 [Xenia sp. Carnegie-2017]|uniref:serine/threonine-protein phosphatase 1 regulatory subunit 10-like isoform X2 n=1 Tax=Xenia sp. Carnegie-2017 TaxID=2897299 RepID=UPI001F04DBB8|nr:serine/threonine-protein phosphatase 1 regulatory subunit 10-like isoform X2 [Xenia sp. Carnegie-2017]